MKKYTLQILMLLLVFATTISSAMATDNDQLTPKQEALVSIASFTTQGKIEALEIALNEGLDAGLTINEIKETLTQLYAYCGFPRSLNGINAFRKVLKIREEKGIKDEEGKAIVLPESNIDKYEKGRLVLEELTQMPQAKPAPGFGEFAPRIDAFLKEHLFADIFDSEVLSYQQRELATIATLASMSGVEPQLMAHLNFGMNVGLSSDQLNDLFSVIETTVGETEAANGRKALQNIINYRNSKK